MNLTHIGVVSSSESNADRFYADVLGLAKTQPKTLPRTLSKSMFDIDRDLLIINYTGLGVHVEVFIDGERARRTRPIEHACLEVNDLAALLQRCRDAGLSVIRVPKGDKVVTFIEDPDHNLFEIKSK